jgi:hypothetical protein
MTYLVEMAMPLLEIPANDEESILAAVREYVAENGLQVYADPTGDESLDEEEYLSLLWRPEMEMHYGTN